MGRKMNIEIDLDNFTEEQENKFFELLNIGKDGHKSRVWKPRVNEAYYYISSLGNIGRSVWRNDSTDNFRWETGNAFKTRNEAEFALEKLKVKAELERYALKHNDPDCKVWNQCNLHHYILYNTEKKSINIANYCIFNIESVTYFTSEEIAKDAIKAIGEKRIIKYLFGVDCEEDE